MDFIQEVLLNTYVLFISETVTLPKDEVAFMQQWMLQQQKQHEETLVSVYLHFTIFKHFMFLLLLLVLCPFFESFSSFTSASLDQL